MPWRPSHLRALSLLTFLLACDGGAGRIDQACQSNADCASSELCATGLCEGGLGACIERPTTCEDVDSPVCGCDGRTYQTDCFATRAGVRLATNQPCFCQDNGGCVEGQFCNATTCDGPGGCEERPTTCAPQRGRP
jgi:hypothetical protein